MFPPHLTSASNVECEVNILQDAILLLLS